MPQTNVLYRRFFICSSESLSNPCSVLVMYDHHSFIHSVVSDMEYSDIHDLFSMLCFNFIHFVQRTRKQNEVHCILGCITNRMK